MIVSPWTPSFPATSASDLAEEFLQQNPDRRLQVLQQIGLARFAPLLLPLSSMEPNRTCLIRLFTAPDRVKFPDLRHVDLRGVGLRGVNLIRADLTGACLRDCDLQDADLLFANLTAVDLTAADLRGATLYQTQWQRAQVRGCRFGSGLGLDPDIWTQLLHQGGIFT